MAREQILILEDDLAVMNLMSKQLTSAGYYVTSLVEGRTAIESCHMRQPELVITDLNMPGMDGFAFIRQLRQEKFKAPIVVVSGMGRKKGEEAVKAGATTFILKPVDRDLLLSVVRKEIVAARTPPPKQHILVFEDEPTAQRLLHATLEPAGFRVTTTENGAAALEVVENDPPDLVVCDIVVPGMTGIELITKLRQEYKYQAPIVVVTGHTIDRYRQAVKDAGANVFVAKPFKPPELLARVRELLAGTDKRD
ncbi:response regulator [candidate division WOR-3 bacterium]|nr:response regulator [candidate division WOR-3 bacterium]